MVKTRTKISIVTVVGAGAFLGFIEIYNYIYHYKNYVSSEDMIGLNADLDTNTIPTSQTYPSFVAMDGKIIELAEDTIIVDVPQKGEKTFTIDQYTKIESFFHPIEEGALVDIEANGNLAYKRLKQKKPLMFMVQL